jgi:hypothetical protein
LEARALGGTGLPDAAALEAAQKIGKVSICLGEDGSSSTKARQNREPARIIVRLVLVLVLNANWPFLYESISIDPATQQAIMSKVQTIVSDNPNANAGHRRCPLKQALWEIRIRREAIFIGMPSERKDSPWLVADGWLVSVGARFWTPLNGSCRDRQRV